MQRTSIATEAARFAMVWNDGGAWKLARVISYDHRLAEPAPQEWRAP